MATTDIPFDQFVLKFDQSLRRMTDLPERGRVQMSVLLQKRFRGESLGDRIGRWNLTTNHWVEPEILELMPLNIYTRNIVKKIVRTNASAMSQASIQVECDARKESDTRCKKNALICQRITDWFDDEFWTTDFALHINELKQLSHGVFIKTVCKSYEKGEDDWAEEAFNLPSEAACPQCGWGGYVKDGQNTCPQCNAEVQTNDEGQDVVLDFLKSASKQPEYRTELKVIPALAMILDERYSQGGNIEKCRYVVERELMSRFEIEEEFGITDLGSAPDWSFATKWLYTLQSGVQYPFKSYKTSQDTIRELDLFEVRRIYFTDDFLDCYTAKQAYDFKSENEDLKFSLDVNQKAGDRVRQMAQEDAEKRNSPLKKKGLCVALITDRILGYYLQDHRQVFDYTYFLSDPYSVWGLCYSELETHQHLVNQTLTAIGNQVQSNQNVAVLNREAFDEDDVNSDKQFIFTRDNGTFDDIRKTFDMIPAIPVSADTWTLYQNMVQSIDEDALASKEMQGIPSGVKTAYQAQMNRDQSVGTLAPANQSMASCKVGAAKKQCLHVQDSQDVEFLTDLCVADDGLITDEDIQHFLESDLDETVVFTYQPGSEVPKTRFDRQQDVAEFGNLLQVLAMANPAGIQPELIQKLISKTAEYKNLDDIDPGNTELDRELAERRFEIIEQALHESLQQQLQIPQDPQSVAMAVLQQAMSSPILFPLPLENHTIAVDFWRDKAIQEMKKDRPDMLLIQACQMMIERHDTGTVTAGQDKVNQAIQIQQPATDMQNAQAEQQQAAASQAEGAQAQAGNQAELQKQAMETHRQAADQNFQLLNKAIDAEENDTQRQHELKLEKQRSNNVHHSNA